MKTKAVRIYGVDDLRLEEFELPKIKDDEILAKIVSDSICMSSHKLAMQGDKHKRVRAPLATTPTIIGHEFCGELVEVGAKWKGQFKAGQKFAIQPALNKDGTVPVNQSQLLFDALKQAGVRVHFHTIKGAGHGQGFGGSEIEPMVAAFFDKYLKSKSPPSNLGEATTSESDASAVKPLPPGKKLLGPWCFLGRFARGSDGEQIPAEGFIFRSVLSPNS